MLGYIYLLNSLSTNKKYLGSTTNLEQREVEHNRGTTTSTRGKGPWEIVQFWRFDSIQEAKRIEYKIKRMKIKLSVEKVNELVLKIRAISSVG
jgi:predicted GIY-YIG superfamily endonuclease